MSAVLVVLNYHILKNIKHEFLSNLSGWGRVAHLFAESSALLLI